MHGKEPVFRRSIHQLINASTRPARQCALLFVLSAALQCGCAPHTPAPQPLRVREPLQIALLLSDDPFWQPFAERLEKEAQARSWNTRVWFASSADQQRAEITAWKGRAPLLALVAPAGREVASSLRDAAGSTRVAVMGRIDPANWVEFDCLTLVHESGVRQAAEEVMARMRGMGAAQPTLLYFGRKGDAERRKVARRLFLDTARGSGGQVGFLLTGAERRGAKKVLKEWLLADPARVVHGIFGEDETLTLALLDAMLETGLRPPALIGSGSSAELAEALISGRLDGLVSYLPAWLASQTMEWAAGILPGSQPPSELRVEPLLLTSENVELLLEEGRVEQGGERVEEQSR